jgi:hypothetical protein
MEIYKKKHNLKYDLRVFFYPCTKFVVPSIGSIIHVGSSPSIVLTPAAADSSPINL